ncbi:NAD-P-binding protein [Artomyces pyxidatus]|uniref:NAD-P-binding protein n=1 Tax=Artomyces pyxidatus TaxID=48021 RepID=A0ACB8T5Y2_9AGAM|nr:NAD-P-binding protein [Artomyces pyxidatus]
MSLAGGTIKTRFTHGFDATKFAGLDEDLTGLTTHKDIYSTIDPAPLIAARALEGKVVLVTGASRGIGAEIARYFVRAGASVSLLARNQVQLDAVKAGIEAECPGARVLALTVDVKDSVKAASAVEATVQAFGKLDALVANAGAMRSFGTRFGSVNPIEWWDTIEVNLRGPFNFIHSSISYLQKSNGYVVVISSAAAQIRLPTASDYSVSKHAVDRLVEFVPIEYPGVKAFALHPGNVDTQLTRDAFENPAIAFDDNPALAASTVLYLTGGKADWLSGRYLSSHWDLGELEKVYKERILAKNALVNKLYLP